MTFNITTLKEEDIEEIINFHNKYLGKKDFINKGEILKRLNSDIFLLAKDENEGIIGIKMGYIDNDICIGRGIAVDPRYRGLGIGRALVREFENRLKQFPTVKKYIFASSTIEGVPFHIAIGYIPSVLIQSKKREDLDSLDLERFNITEEIYNKEFDTYQIYTEYNDKLDYEYLKLLQDNYPSIDIQYLFEREIT